MFRFYNFLDNKKKGVKLMSEKLHIVVFGAHPGDAEITAGGTIAKYVRAGHKVTLVHLTAGERGHPKMSPQEYKKQRQEESSKAARVLGADFMILQHEDGTLSVDEEIKNELASLIRELKPDIVITHWKGSDHRDHSSSYDNVRDAVFYAASPLMKSSLSPHTVKAVYATENYEDKTGYTPDAYIDISESFQRKFDAVKQHAVFREDLYGTHFIEYYASLARVRGLEAGFGYADNYVLYIRRRGIPLCAPCITSTVYKDRHIGLSYSIISN